MLGAHADHFMLAQMRERVTAITPNAGGRSLELPDRERYGTAQVMVKRGFGAPGPQRTVSSGYVPGMGSVATPPPPPTPGALPGMSGGVLPGMGSGAMPGMGSGAMPGMGSLDGKSIALLAAAALGIYLVTKK